MDFIQTLDGIADSSAPRQIAFVSGSSYILQDYRFPIKKIQVKGTSKTTRQISFNQSGSLHDLPSSDVVYKLNTSFNGVIISGIFKIHRSMLTMSEDKHGNKN